MTQQLPQFSSIDIKNFPQKLSALLDEYRGNIKKLLSDKSEKNWQQLMAPMESWDDELHQLWSPFSHMHAVKNNDEIRTAYQACLPMLSDFSSELGQNRELFHAVKQLSEQNSQLNAVQNKIINDDLLDFTLSGVALSDENKRLFADNSKRLSELSNQFENNLLDAIQAWSKTVDNVDALAGLPQHAIVAAKELADKHNESGWRLCLEFPCYHAVVTYAEDRALREEMYQAFVTRASDQGPFAGRWDNSDIMNEIRALKHQQAKLLGYQNYAEVSLARKMVDKPSDVIAFLEELVAKSKSQAEKEFAELQTFAKAQHGIDDIKPWDMSYLAEKLRIERYAISQEDLRPYFPEDRVLEGMFAIVKQLYGISVEESDTNTWHEDVRFFQLFDETGSLRGQVYFDLYARVGKRGGAWMDDCIGRRLLDDGSVQVPTAFLTCNFTAPVSGKTACFSHDEVITLFHEFGHCLHHLLTQIDHLAVSGINGVEWDAVELPSQFFENWCWTQEGLALMSAHVDSGEKLPQDVFDKLMAAKNFQSAMGMLRQLEFALFDFRLFLEFDPESPVDIQTLLDEVKSKVSVVPTVDYNRFAHGFSHIFAGGYSAGYYSYKWAEVLSSDAFSRFEEQGVMSAECGRDFMQAVLEQGGSRPAMDSFIAFRGRKPEIDALLRHSGINHKA